MGGAVDERFHPEDHNILSAARADERAVEEAAKKGIKINTREIPTEAEGER